MNQTPEITITDRDKERLERMLDAIDSAESDALLEGLDRATLVAQREVPPNVVTMNSALVFEDEDAGERREVTLVYPERSRPADGHVSVLAPMGTALLGLAVGARATWTPPSGRSRRLRVVAVTYQPEAAGDFHL